MENYYIVWHVFKNKPYQSGHHMIRAMDSQKAIEIAVKHKITLPLGRIDIESSKATLCEDQERIYRRKLGIGGRVWFENEDGTLGIESINR